ncbi:helix-turn-helix transcriptional regulator [Haoranjiania flava]|uniref:WYL domain-containing protein n=1 Tax=Haoranjiania flava TaxID=1856322 RepID=A0AAE3IKI0_9BACT|nr:WYL domain-containing protein [Haoranjiania flava]MCU7693967.1 WYL domain-containing protein [Haoranjiania flava]
MPYHKKIKTYLHILEKFSGINRVNLNSIQHSLKCNYLPASLSSINRAIRELRAMGYDICWNAEEKYYTLESSPNENNKLLKGTLNLMVYADFLKEITESPEGILDYIDFDEKIVSKGAEYLKQIFDAIKTKKWLKITYSNFRDDKLRKHKLAPLMIKEYNARWYLFAVLKAPSCNKQDEAYFFGLDRIVKMAILNDNVPEGVFQRLQSIQKLKKENKQKEISPKDWMREFMGVIFSKENVQEVILKIESSQAPYVKSQPWHHTQIVLADEPDNFQIALYLRPNEELEYKILSFSGRAEVIAPVTFRKKIINTLEKALRLYHE